MESCGLAEENTPEERLTEIIARACVELKMPDEYINEFSDNVAECVKEKEKENVHFDATKISNSMGDYEILVSEAPQRDAETLTFEVYALAALTASYFLAKEAVLKDKNLMALFSPKEGWVH